MTLFYGVFRPDVQEVLAGGFQKTRHLGGVVIQYVWICVDLAYLAGRT